MKNKIEGSPVLLILADHDVDWLMQTAQELSFHHQLKVVGFAQNSETLVDHVINMAADAVLMNYAIPNTTAGEMARRLQDEAPGVSVFAVSDSLTPQLRDSAKSDGVVEVYDKHTFDAREIANEITAHVDKLRVSWADKKRRHKESVGRATIEPVTEVAQTIILTYNPKGGVGKTAIATNLAAAIKMSPYLMGLRVCLVDFDCSGANVATACHIDDVDVVNRNLSVWEHLPDNLRGPDIDEILIDGPHGIKIVAAPLNPAAAERVNAELAEKILRILRKHFTIIIIDGSPTLTVPVDVAISYATHILLVANPEGQSVKQLSRTVHLLKPDPDYPEKPDMSHILDKMFLILNHTQPPSKYDLKKSEISENIGKPIYAEIPYDEVIKRSLHGTKARMAVELEPHGGFATAIKALANDICGAYPGKKQKGESLFGKILKRRR